MQKISKMLFPSRCFVCDKVLETDEKGICEACRKELTAITEPICKKCGKPIASHEQEYCFDCKGKDFYFVRGYAVWTYDKQMKDSIARFKFGDRKEYGEFYVKELIYYLGTNIQKIQPDLIIPVPLHKKKKRFRGFNQTALLADGIGKKLMIPVNSDLLIRNKNTAPQKGLTHKERVANLSNAFLLQENRKSDLCNVERVLLVDDIYTTGSTINECAKVLLEAGVKEIYFVCLCIGKDF